MKDKKLTIQEVVTLCAVIVFFGVLTYINFCCYRRYVDSDSAAEALLAMRIRGTHHLFPETWYISTDRRTIATAVPAAVFYFITGNAAFSMALSCTLFSIVMGLSLIYMMRGAGASMNASLTALLLLMALPVNPGHIMFESGFPYFMTLLFLFASHYSGYFTFFFLTVGTALRLRHDGERAERKHIVFAAVLCLVAFIYGGAGMRGLQLVTLPFLCFAVLCFLKGTDLFRRKDRVSARELGLSFIMVLCSLGGGVISGAPAVHTGMADPQSVFSNFTTATITNPLALLGGEKTDSLSSPESFLQLLMWGAVILSVYAFFRL
ncbi:MAG: hypothetical protein K6E33_05180, partial [Lachnospiraceae bacterium]|nr:hypothetical protein [Lachnospiraceae bacterium]